MLLTSVWYIHHLHIEIFNHGKAVIGDQNQLFTVSESKLQGCRSDGKRGAGGRLEYRTAQSWPGLQGTRATWTRRIASVSWRHLKAGMNK